MPAIHSAYDIFSNVSKNDYINISNLRNIPDFLDFHKSDVAKATNQPQASVRYDNRISGELEKRLREIGNIINIVTDYFDGDLVKAKLWFDTSNPLLGDMSPRDMIRYGRYTKLHKFITNALAGNMP